MTRNLFIATGLLCGVISAPAFGDNYRTFTNVDLGNSSFVKLTVQGGGFAGRFTGHLGNRDINDFCVDLGHDVGIGDTYRANVSHRISDASGPLVNGYYRGGLGSAIDTGYIPNNGGTFTSQERADQVAYLIHSYGNSKATDFTNGYTLNQNMAAVNLAIWDIENDGGDGISAGSVSGNTATINTFGTLVNTLEAQAAVHKNQHYMDVQWIQAPIANGTGFQSFGFIAPVPEAGTVTLFGLLLTGGLIRLRSSKKKQSTEA